MTDPGWYHAEGDAPNTMRYWDGGAWQGEPVAAGNPVGAGGPPPPPSLAFQGSAPNVETVPPEHKLSGFGYWKRCWTTNYANFSGRARRSEYGWFALINGLISLLFVIPLIVVLLTSDLSGESSEPPALFWYSFIPLVIFSLAAVIPGLAVAVRRWHDLGQSGWILLVRLLQAIPLSGSSSDSECSSSRYSWTVNARQTSGAHRPKYGSVAARQPWQ